MSSEPQKPAQEPTQETRRETPCAHCKTPTTYPPYCIECIMTGEAATHVVQVRSATTPAVIAADVETAEPTEPTDIDRAFQVLPEHLSGVFWNDVRKRLATEMFRVRIQTRAAMLKEQRAAAETAAKEASPEPSDGTRCTGTLVHNEHEFCPVHDASRTSRSHGPERQRTGLSQQVPLVVGDRVILGQETLRQWRGREAMILEVDRNNDQGTHRVWIFETEETAWIGRRNMFIVPPTNKPPGETAGGDEK